MSDSKEEIVARLRALKGFEGHLSLSAEDVETLNFYFEDLILEINSWSPDIPEVKSFNVGYDNLIEELGTRGGITFWWKFVKIGESREQSDPRNANSNST